MQSNISSIQYTPEIILGNLEIMATFEEGEKPLLNFSTGVITKETRSFAYLRRKLGGFDAKAVERTFGEADGIIKAAANLHQRKIKILTKDSTAVKIYRQYLKTIGGVRTMAKTYRDEGNDTVADQLDAVAMVYFAKFSELPSLQELADSPRATLRRRLNTSPKHEKPLPVPTAPSPASPSGDSMKACLLADTEREPYDDSDTASKEEDSGEDDSALTEQLAPRPPEIRIQMDPKAVESLQIAEEEGAKKKGKGIVYKILGCCLKG